MNILNLLDGDLAEADRAQNYENLLAKWGTMEITRNGGLQVTFINISKAFINGASVSYLICTITMFAAAILFGKIVFPQLAKMYTSSNDQMADLAAIQTNELIKEKKAAKKEWF